MKHPTGNLDSYTKSLSENRWYLLKMNFLSIGINTVPLLKGNEKVKKEDVNSRLSNNPFHGVDEDKIIKQKILCIPVYLDSELVTKY